jgi:hypothetical protein
MTLYLIKLLYTIKCINLFKKDYALSLINVNTLYKERSYGSCKLEGSLGFLV